MVDNSVPVLSRGKNCLLSPIPAIIQWSFLVADGRNFSGVKPRQYLRLTAAEESILNIYRESENKPEHAFMYP